MLIDADLKPWLIEVNVTPSLAIHSADQTQAAREERAVKERLMQDLFRLVGVDAPPPQADAEEAVVARFDAELARYGGFQRVYPTADADTWLPTLAWPRRLDRILAHHVCPKVELDPPPLYAQGVRVLPLGRQLVLVSEATGAVRALNPTAGYSWLRIEDGASSAEVARELAVRFGQPLTKVRAEVDAAVAEWIEVGLVDLVEASPVQHMTRRTRRCALAGLALEVTLPDDMAQVVDVVAPPATGDEPVVGAVEVLPEASGYLLRTGEGLAMACDQPHGLGPALRAILIQRVAHRTLGARVAIPASAVCSRDGSVLLPGSNDSPRSCLALACALTGMDLICDELALLDASFAVLPNALPPALPGHDVAAFERLLPALADALIHCLSTGTPVRYFPALAPTGTGSGVPVVALVLPVSGNGRRTRLLPLDPCKVLERLITLGLCSFPAPDAETLEGLVAWLDGVPCWELEVADLWPTGLSMGDLPAKECVQSLVQRHESRPVCGDRY